MKTYFDYILASKKYGILYVGITNNLIRRVAEHKRKEVKGFTKKYNVDKLLWFEQTNNVKTAIEKEKHIKK